MFGILKGIAKVAVGVVTLPLDIAADVVTLGGAMTEKEKPYTAKKVSKIFDAIDEAMDD